KPPLASEWLDPQLTPSGTAPGGLQRHSPYAAITVDAYTGAQPADHYPAVAYPAWTNIEAPYDKAPTNGVAIEDVYISGFAVGIMDSPNVGGGNSITIKDTNAIYNVYGIALANAQSRNVHVINDDFAMSHTFLTNRNFGTG